jgi:RecA-family ATPase
VMYLSCEDRERVLHYRLSRICRYEGINLASLRGWLEVVDLVGHDTVLWERDPRTGFTFTSAFGELAERVKAHETELLIVDGISDTFGGNENARGDAKRFINALVGLIPPDRGAVLLVGHIAKPAAASAATSEGYSGSTGWHNSVRARWYLYPETEPGEDGGRPERTGDLILELQKSNLGRTDQQMRFRWDDEAHLFRR